MSGVSAVVLFLILLIAFSGYQVASLEKQRPTSLTAAQERWCERHLHPEGERKAMQIRWEGR